MAKLKREPESFLETIERHSQALQHPPKSREEYMDTLEKHRLGITADAIRQAGWIES